jgi:hypothetical protein
LVLQGGPIPHGFIYFSRSGREECAQRISEEPEWSRSTAM